MPRPMTSGEKQRFHGYFPSLNVDQAVVTGEISTVYNCISWTVGVTDRWLWPGSSIADFDIFYRGFGFVRAGDGSIAAWGHSTANMTHYLTAAEKKALRDQVNSVPTEMRAAFEAAFSAWKDTWFSGGLAISSNPHTRAVGTEFDALIALGPAILPLVIEKLADPENFLALQLYDAMQPNERLIVQFEPEDERILEGEQGRARRVVHAWFANQ
jgi:hypothetical protein